MIRLLLQKGGRVTYHDPHVLELNLDGATLKSVDLSDEALSTADLVVIVTNHASIDYRRVVAKAQRIYDTRNATKEVREGREKIRKL